MEWLKDKFRNFSDLSIWMKILVVLLAALFPVLFVVWIAGKILSRQGTSVAERTGGSDDAHDDVMETVLEETGAMDLGLEQGQDDARVKRLAAEEKVMEDDNGKKLFHSSVDAAADAGSVDAVLSQRDDRRGRDR